MVVAAKYVCDAIPQSAAVRFRQHIGFEVCPQKVVRVHFAQ